MHRTSKDFYGGGGRARRADGTSCWKWWENGGKQVESDSCGVNARKWGVRSFDGEGDEVAAPLGARRELFACSQSVARAPGLQKKKKCPQGTVSSVASRLDVDIGTARRTPSTHAINAPCPGSAAARKKATTLSQLSHVVTLSTLVAPTEVPCRRHDAPS